MEEKRLKIEKQIEKEKDAEIASLKNMVKSLQRQLAAAKNISEPGSAVSQADAPEPTAGAMEQPPMSNNDKIRK